MTVPVPFTLSAACPGRREVVITSFGFGHAAPPAAEVVYDARRSLRNPHHDPAMRHRTGLEPVVREHVLSTPGAVDTVRALAALVTHLLPIYDTPHATPCTWRSAAWGAGTARSPWPKHSACC